jgi:CDP-paratose 2-epimerase
MKIFITGICGYVGATLAREFRGSGNADALQISGLDNFSRAGSETNRLLLQKLDVKPVHGDIRLPSDLEAIGDVDWVMDAAANPSVLAGVDGRTSSRQLVEHNLQGTINLLEFRKARKAGLILLSTSRVYSAEALAAIRVEAVNGAFRPVSGVVQPVGLSDCGISEDFPTTAPLSLYGATKRASEQLALEYGAAFGFPVWINRCGVLAGAGQFGRGDQGIFSFWIHSWLRQHPLKYIGFGGQGHQVRDCLHPRDLVPLLRAQMADSGRKAGAILNLGGGVANSLSLAQLGAWCTQRFGVREVTVDPVSRPFDAPWIVMDCAHAARDWDWRVQTSAQAILEEIADHAQSNPQWLELTG